MIARIDFTYTSKIQIAKDEALWNQVAEILPIGKWEGEKSWISFGEMVVDITLVGEKLMELGVEFEVKAVAQNAFIKDVDAKLQELTRKLKLVEIQLYSSGKIVQVHVPNLGLLAINEVQYMENACTEALQRELEAGWRILAVCPPLMERRPTYIIGRYNPSLEKDQDKPVFKTIGVAS